jgi:hypothetical protein
MSIGLFEGFSATGSDLAELTSGIAVNVLPFLT